MTAAIYTRQSFDRTGEEAGVMRQLKECRERAKDFTVAFELSDNDTSATTGVARPGFEKLLSLLKSEQIDTVVVWHTDRLYRKLKDLVRIVDVASEHKLTIITVKAGEIDLNSATGRMVATILGSVSTQEREHRTDRQKSAYSDYAEHGIWHFSHRPFGYTAGPKIIGPKGTEIVGPPVQVPAEAAELKSLYKRFYEGRESYHALVKDLNGRGVLTTKGLPWTITQLRSVLWNPHNAGFSFYKGKEVGMGQWEPIITPDEWDLYTGAKSKRKVTSTFNTTATSLLSGLMTCDVCDGKIYRKTRSAGVYEYSCSAHQCVSIKSGEVDKKVRSAVIDALLFAPTNAIPVDDSGMDLGTIANALSELETRSGEIAQAWGSGLLKGAQATPQLEAIKEQEKVLKARRANILGASAVAEVLMDARGDLFTRHKVSFAQAAKVKVKLGERFDAMTLKRQRELAKLLLDIRVCKGRGVERVNVWHLVSTSLNEPDELAQSA